MIPYGPSTYQHLRARYSFNEVRAIFDVPAPTLRGWMKSGVSMPDGQSADLPFFHLGRRGPFFYQDDIARICQMRGNRVVPFPAHVWCDDDSEFDD